MLKDDCTFVRSPKNAGKRQFAGMRWWMPRTLRVLAENMLSHDDPDHRRLRKLVDQAFNRQNVEGLRERIGDLCDGLLDRQAGAGPMDLMGGLARPLPLTVICELLGLPEEDRPQFRRWVQAMMSVTSLWGAVLFLPGLFRLVGYFKRHFAECRREPRRGLMTALVQAEQAGDQLSENELLAMAFLLLVAGHETTVHLIGGGVLSLLEAPELKARLMADWSLVLFAVEELLRFVSPVQVAKPRYMRRLGLNKFVRESVHSYNLAEDALALGEAILELASAWRPCRGRRKTSHEFAETVLRPPGPAGRRGRGPGLSAGGL